MAEKNNKNIELELLSLGLMSMHCYVFIFGYLTPGLR